MTQKEQRHVNKVLRVLRTAAKELEVLAETASSDQTFPRTTLKAFVEVSEALSKAQIRVAAKDASVV